MNVRASYILRLTAGACTALALLICSGCSTKRNTASSRKYTAFITRYNVYFNGNEHYNTTLRDMEQKYEDDFSNTLFLHPAEAHADEKATKPTGDFKRSIEKAQKAIQLRSIKKRPSRRQGRARDPEYKKWLQREEYNPFLHNAWMMMARSQYMNGDFFGAVATFYYIAKHFWWLPTIVTEAKIWQARCYAAEGWTFEAESLLRSIKPSDTADNPTLAKQLDFAWADTYVHARNWAEAIPYLKRAAAAAKGSQKARLTFLLGQLYQYTDQPELAYQAWNQAGRMSGASHRTKFNARIKQSEVFQGQNIDGEVKALRSLARYGANADYLDQIYRAIGNLQLSRGDTLSAIDSYHTAIAKSTRADIDKALAQVALADILYAQGKYHLAQPQYAEGVPQLPDTYPAITELRRRSDNLDQLSVYSNNVALQDSLLELAELTPEEQRKVAQRLADELTRREKEEAEAAKRDEYLAQQAAAGNGLRNTGTSAPTTFTLNNDKSWYFYNQATRQAGITEFQKRWGSRRLEDDWRRRNKASFALGSEYTDAYDSTEPSDSTTIADNYGADPTDPATREAAEHAADPHFPEYYLKQIPQTDLEKATSREVIQEGLYNEGLILKDYLDDPVAAATAWQRLLTQYPDNVYRLDVYYNLYLMYQRMNDTVRADQYRDLILQHFPTSPYGTALADPDYMDKLRRMPVEEQRLYDSAFTAYMDGHNATLHGIYATMQRDYPMSRIMPKFMFLEALSYATEQNPEQFAQVLRSLTERYPDTDVAPLASNYLNLLSKGMKLNAPSAGSNPKGMVWSTRLMAAGTDSTSITTDPDAPAQFDFDAKAQQVVLLIYDLSSVDSRQLLYQVALHNFYTYTVADFEIEQLQFGRLGITVVTGLPDRAEAERYRSGLGRSQQFTLPRQVVTVVMSQHDFDLLLDEGRTLQEYFAAAGDATLDRIYTNVVSPQEQTPATSTPAEQKKTEQQTIQLEETTPNFPTGPDTDEENTADTDDLTNDEFDVPVPLVPDFAPIATPTQP